MTLWVNTLNGDKTQEVQKMKINQKSLGRAAMSGIALAVLFAVVNGVSSWVLSDDAGPITLETWVDNKVGA